ncbi:EI24 domain-containing protein [Massilia sp. TS11]|uniref:EI24 domain-containing protein n=1 Tax=Massilia sp. TS11 TaxID=2908003 RepID=UPI001EDC6D92|nr:EI24 domain-containing protein [Massilia sp. TS11]MCG2586006.1 EI24 domain-containing protein [Massilia sp. TS11]
MSPNLFRSAARACGSILHPRMQLLAAVPVLLALALWAVLLWLGLQPLLDWLTAAFAEHGWYAGSSAWLANIGLGFLKVAVVPMLAFLSLLPIMGLSALVLVGSIAMPLIVKHVAQRFFPALEQRGQGGFFGSLLLAAKTAGTFFILWLAALPLYIVPPLAICAHVLLWGWMTQRLFTYDALSVHADAAEQEALARAHKPTLILMGIGAGVAGAVPSAVWLGGAVFSIALFPFLAALSVWLFVMIFVLTGLWFTHYCLLSLSQMRAGPPA